MNAIARYLLATVIMISPALTGATSPPPAFETYRTPLQAHSRAAALRLQTRQDREYRTELTEAFRQPANFAGHYVLATIGCGASCILTAALDKNTGAVSWLPFTVCCWGQSIVEPLRYRADSQLLVVHGQRDEQGAAGPHYYRFAGGSFKEVR